MMTNPLIGQPRKPPMAQGLEIATRPTAEDVQVAADELMHRYDVKKIDLPLMREVVERELQSQLRLPPSKRNNQMIIWARADLAALDSLKRWRGENR
jgi:hypothetical protein